MTSIRQKSENRKAVFRFSTNSFRGQDNISDVIFSEEDNQPYIYFSSPVIIPENKNPIGILRQKYDANVLQYILQDNSNLVGENTFPILVDENLFRLGDILNVSNLYKTLAPISTTQAMLLRSIHRISADEKEEISTKLLGLAGTLQNKPDLTFFSTQLNPENPYLTSQNFIATAKAEKQTLDAALHPGFVLGHRCFGHSRKDQLH